MLDGRDGAAGAGCSCSLDAADTRQLLLLLHVQVKRPCCSCRPGGLLLCSDGSKGVGLQQQPLHLQSTHRNTRKVAGSVTVLPQLKPKL